MKTFTPNVGRELKPPTRRADNESPHAENARRERMAFYSGRRWRRVARLHLARNPLCTWCGRLADMVDHIVPRLDRPDLAYNADNLRSACRSCHATRGRKAKSK